MQWHVAYRPDLFHVELCHDVDGPKRAALDLVKQLKAAGAATVRLWPCTPERCIHRA